MKTIFFIIASYSRINFILRTDVFRLLKAKGYRLVIISPFSGDEKFQSEFGGSNVYFEDLPRLNRLGRFVGYLRTDALRIKHPVLESSRKIYNAITRRYRKEKTWLLQFKQRLMTILLECIPSKIRDSRVFWERVESFFVRSRQCGKLFRKYAPDAVVMASGGAEGNDALFIIYANRFRVPTFAIDSNFDVFEFRYFSAPRAISRWALFSELQREEGNLFQGIPLSHLVVTGPVRYDFYFRGFVPEPRESFLKRIGVDPGKKLITFGAKTPLLYPYNDDIIRILLAAIQENGQAELFVRFDPGHDPFLYKQTLPYFKWESAGKIPEQEHVANLLYHSDVVISIGSTFSNEACLVDTPAIWVGFDGYTTCDKTEDSYAFIYELPLFRRILKTGGIPLARNPDELISLVGQYLKNPALHKQERLALIEQEYFKSDGLAGSRIVAQIEAVLQNSDV